MKKVILLTLLSIAARTICAQWVSSFTSNATGHGVSLAEGKNGEIFLAMHDQYSGKPMVKKFANGVWTSVGDSIFGFWAGELKLAVKSDGNPVVVFQDINRNYQLTAMQFNGTSWDTMQKRGMSGFTSAGDVGIATLGSDIVVCFQQFNQIKGWKWDGSSSFTSIGAGGIISTGFPGGCELYAKDQTLYLVYRDNNNKGILRTATAADGFGVWTTVGTSFGATHTEIPRIAVIPGGIPFVGTRTSASVLNFHFRFAGTWNSGPSLPSNAKDFRLSLLDSSPIIATRDLSDRCHFYKGNLSTFRWDSIGGSSIVSSAVLGGNPAILGTSDKRVFIAFQDANLGGKISVITLCSDLSGAKIVPEAALSSKLCSGGTKTLLLSKNPARVKWIKDGNIILNETKAKLVVSSPGVYQAWAFNGCNDSFVSNIYSVVACNSTKPVINFSNGELSTGNYALYQWTLNGVDISTAKSATFTPSEGGAYKVKVVSTDTCFLESDVFNFWPASNTTTALPSFSVYPNPAENLVHIGGIQDAVLTISEISGRKLKSVAIHGNTTVDLQNLPQGILILSIQNRKSVLLIH